MPTTDPVKNLQYVRKSQQKKKAEIGVEAFNTIHSNAQSKYRDNLKQAAGLDEYKKQQAEYMKQYRAKQRQIQQEAIKKEKAIMTLTDAIRFRKAKQEMAMLKEKKAINELIAVIKRKLTSRFEPIEAKQEVKRRPGRPRKPRNPVGRPKGSKNKPKVDPVMTMTLRPRKS